MRVFHVIYLMNRPKIFRKPLTVEEKASIIKKFDEKGSLSISDFAKTLALSESTVRTIIKKRKLVEDVTCNSTCKRRRLKPGKYTDLEKILVQWIHQSRAPCIPISGAVIKEKAIEVAKSMSISNFTASNGWLDRFKARHGIVFRHISGEPPADTWVSEVLPGLLHEYSPQDIYTADEFGLFFKMTPYKSSVFRSDACHDGKASEERLTVLLCTNSTGTDKLKPLVIGKSENPRCFKHIKLLPCIYDHQQCAWMTVNRFREWLLDLNSEMAQKKRRIIIFIDDCPAHPKQQDYGNVQVQFLPPSSTGYLQPLDQGIIKAVKHYYRKKVMLKFMGDIDEGVESIKISVLDALHNLTAAWHNVTAETIENCFKRAGFRKGDVKEDNLNLDKVINGVNMEEYTAIDDNLETTDCRTVEVINSLDPAENCGDGSDSDDELQSTPVPNICQALNAIQTLQNYFGTTEKSPHWYSWLYSMENSVMLARNCVSRQETLHKFLNQ